MIYSMPNAQLNPLSDAQIYNYKRRAVKEGSHRTKPQKLIHGGLRKRQRQL